MNRQSLAWGIIASLAGFLVWPWWSLWVIYSSAQENDHHQLRRYIDFDRVRASLTEQLAGNHGGAWGAFLQGAAGELVEQWLRPETLSRLLGGGGSGGGGVDSQRFINAIINQTTIHYGAGVFSLVVDSPDYGRVALVLERVGGLYRLVDLRIKGA